MSTVSMNRSAVAGWLAALSASIGRLPEGVEKTTLRALHFQAAADLEKVPAPAPEVAVSLPDGPQVVATPKGELEVAPLERDRLKALYALDDNAARRRMLGVRARLDNQLYKDGLDELVIPGLALDGLPVGAFYKYIRHVGLRIICRDGSEDSLPPKRETAIVEAALGEGSMPISDFQA